MKKGARPVSVRHLQKSKRSRSSDNENSAANFSMFAQQSKIDMASTEPKSVISKAKKDKLIIDKTDETPSKPAELHAQKKVSGKKKLLKPSIRPTVESLFSGLTWDDFQNPEEFCMNCERFHERNLHWVCFSPQEWHSLQNMVPVPLLPKPQVSVEATKNNSKSIPETLPNSNSQLVDDAKPIPPRPVVARKSASGRPSASVTLAVVEKESPPLSEQEEREESEGDGLFDEDSFKIKEDHSLFSGGLLAAELQLEERPSVQGTGAVTGDPHKILPPPGVGVTGGQGKKSVVLQE